MKRYAAHYLYLPGCGYLKAYVTKVEIGKVVELFPLTQEIENTEWLPGVIGLFPEGINEKYICLQEGEILKEVPQTYLPEIKQQLIPYLFFPFDFIKMKPVAETRHMRLL